MHNYYPIVARAVARLESNTPAARRELFDRIRLILIDQIRIRRPAISNSEIMWERAELEAAIRKIEWELPALAKSPTELTPAPLSERKIRTVEPNGSSDIVRREPATISEKQNPEDGLTDLPPHQSVAVERQPARGLHILFEQARALLADGVRFREQQFVSVKTLQDRLSIRIANRQSKPEPTRTAAPKADGSSQDANGQPTATNHDAAKELTETANAKILGNLIGIKLLDGLILDAARPSAPGSLKQDQETVFKWLGIGESKAIQPEHYDRFGGAVCRYITECQDPFARLAPAMAKSPSALNDDLRSVLSRMLEQEQTGTIVDRVLTWFANVWIGLFVALNVVAVIGLLIVTPTFRTGLVALTEIYSPFNVWTWIAQALALSPSLAAIAWRNRRLRRMRGAPEAVFGANPNSDISSFAAPLVAPAAVPIK